MRAWLHSLLHWRCDRELSQRDAMIQALMPRYRPVAVHREPLAAALQRERLVVEQELDEIADESSVRSKGMSTSFRTGVRFVEAEK